MHFTSARHHPSLPRGVRYALFVLGALTTGALGVASYVTNIMNKPRRRTPGDDYTFSPFEVQIPHEVIDFQASDGVTLRGWWFPHRNSDRVVIGLTGHRGLKQDLLGIGSSLWRAGNNVLLFDYRGCGESDSAPLSLAHHEMLDVRASLRYVRDRLPDARIALLGFSMGASLAILAAAEDEGVRVVMADSPFTSARDVIAFAYRNHRLPAWPLVGLTDIVNRVRYGYRLNESLPLDAVEKIAPRPLLLIHGGADAVIPAGHSHELVERAGASAELWLLPEVGHCGAYFADRETYTARVAEFLMRELS